MSRFSVPGLRQASDVMEFGQQVGRVLSDGRIVGRAEPFAKVFPSSRAVKRAVGLMAWAVLEDIALDARIDDRGRLVAETTVRRIAANLGLNKDTVTRHLGRLREHGFVFQEESREVTSGRWEACRYVLDPSACIERFTVTPTEAPENARSEPCPNTSDTVAEPVSEPTGHGGTGHGGFGRHERHVVEDPEQHVADPASADGDDTGELRGRLERLGVAAHVAEDLVGRYAPERVRDALDAAEMRGARNTAGWVVSALRDSWDLSAILAERRTREGRLQQEAEEEAQRQAVAAAEQERRDRTTGWSAAVSAALDDDQLATAIAKVTTPMAGLKRRSVPLALAQILAWAVEVHRRASEAPLAMALAASLSNGAVPSPGLDGTDLPGPPATSHPPDLSARIREQLQRSHNREQAIRHAANPESDRREP